MNLETLPHVDRSARYLAQAAKELGRGDTLQASEKGWGATPKLSKPSPRSEGGSMVATPISLKWCVE